MTKATMTRYFILLLALVGISVPAASFAQIEIDITEGNVDPVPIAVPDFLGQDAETQALGAQIAALRARVRELEAQVAEQQDLLQMGVIHQMK